MAESFDLHDPVAEGAVAETVRTAHRGVTSAVSDGWVAGGSFFGSIMAGVLLGWLGDTWLSTDPWLLVGGIIAGSVNGFYRMWILGRAPTGKQAIRVG